MDSLHSTMQKIVQKILSGLGKLGIQTSGLDGRGGRFGGNFQATNYKKSGIRPRNDWLVILGVFFIGLVVIAAFAVYVYTGVQNDTFWHADTSQQGTDIQTLNQARVQQVQNYFNAMSAALSTPLSTSTSAIASSSSVAIPPDPSL